MDLKPYRLALEAMISHHKPVKLSQMLGKAAADLDDPWLRDTLKEIIARLPTQHYKPQEPMRLIAETIKFSGIEEVVDYIEKIIDAGDSAWEILAEQYGWTPPDHQDDA